MELRYFVTLAEERHFGRAAAREHIVQSALSQQIQRLERELGARLVDRSTHHVAVTTAGAVFLVQARQILHEVHARYPDLVIHQIEAGVVWVDRPPLGRPPAGWARAVTV